MVKESIYRNTKRVAWSMTGKQIAAEIKTWKGQGRQIEIKGEKAFGKSTILEFASTTYEDWIVVEGDVLYMYCVWSTQPDYDPNAEIGKAVREREPNLWTILEGDSVKNKLVQKVLGNAIESIDLCSGFHGFKRKVLLMVVPDYQSYVKYFKLRIADMIKKEGAFADHVKKTHKILSYDEVCNELASQMKKARGNGNPVYTIYNSFRKDADLLWEPVLDSLLLEEY